MSTPPPEAAVAAPPSTPSRLKTNTGVPMTPEQVRRMEINRLKAKAIREQKEREDATNREKIGLSGPNVTTRGTKRPFDSVNGTAPTIRNAKDVSTTTKALDSIQPARKFTQFVEYDLSKMNDTKGGFLSTIDDPHSVLGNATAEGKPANMTLEEWEKLQLKRKLQQGKQGAFEPAITEAGKKCQECGSLELDWTFLEVFGVKACGKCKEKYPDKYSLLTKTECREDYLLTDPELRDEEILPHIEKPNPHKSNWATMQLYLRYQVEEFAFKKWGSPEALDAEFEKRTAEQKRRKDLKFKKRLDDLKKRTRVETWKRQGKFDSDRRQKHEHEWGELLQSEEGGMGIKTCLTCGMKVEEMVI